jgi:transcriptional regulator with XRE-family HTH domain
MIRLQELREAKGLSQNELGKRAGVRQSYISMIESGDRGTRVSFDIVSKLAQALEVPIEELRESRVRAT